MVLTGRLSDGGCCHAICHSVPCSGQPCWEVREYDVLTNGTAVVDSRRQQRNGGGWWPWTRGLEWQGWKKELGKGFFPQLSVMCRSPAIAADTSTMRRRSCSLSHMLPSTWASSIVLETRRIVNCSCFLSYFHCYFIEYYYSISMNI